MMANSFDVSLVREHNEEIMREVRANRLGRSLRKVGVHRFGKPGKRRGAALLARAVGAALFCMGVFAVLALAVVAAVLVPVMLVATILPRTVVGHKRDQSVERYAGNALEVSAPRKALATSRQQAG